MERPRRHLPNATTLVVYVYPPTNTFGETCLGNLAQGVCSLACHTICGYKLWRVGTSMQLNNVRDDIYTGTYVLTYVRIALRDSRV